MEAGGRGLLSRPSPPFTSHVPKAHYFKKTSGFSPCPPVMHGPTSRAVKSMPITSVVRHFPASVLLQDQRDDLRHYIVRDDKQPQVTLDRRRMELEELVCQDKDHEFDEYLKYLECRFIYSLGCWYQLPTCTEEKMSSSESTNFIVNDINVHSEIEKQSAVKDTGNDVAPLEVLALAKEAVLASKEAVSLAESHPLTAYVNGFDYLGQGPKDLDKQHVQVEEVIVRSKRILERRSKMHRMPNKMTVVTNDSTACAISTKISKKTSKRLNTNDPLRLFLWRPEAKQLLTVKEERDLVNKIQDVMRLEEVKQKLHLQVGREPTLAEWAEAVGMTCHALQSSLSSGNRSREKIIYANLRLVVHLAKQYHRKGLNFPDLLQEGSMGLMKSLEKFKPEVGCRFPTYAYWWIQQSIRKAISQNSRTIRLPVKVFALLKKIKDARKLYIQEGRVPSNEELARRVGITRERLEQLLASSSRAPVSIQGRAWMDQGVTIQERTADPEVEAPELGVAKRMMRQRVRDLLRVLPPRERQMMQLRYGIGVGERKTLSDTGAAVGLSRCRVWQLESWALDRLKECLTSHGLDAYVNLLI